MKVYISGPISGIPADTVKRRFKLASTIVKALGHEPFNPLNNGLNESHSYKQHMAVDICNLMTCDAIYMMKGWSGSEGCRCEFVVANTLGLEILKVKHDNSEI